ncbi:protein ALUMINUM SENSITIVE 3 [Senna tora]|uniref:Protein ALUMINUM SENSITIVE 3 n=1 Tax=Senna tora TaxID=362788 RepID=A0A834W545_9FABA|nr:protein ALUMINUM SENSITIVE 3 [Senna tora]
MESIRMVGENHTLEEGVGGGGAWIGMGTDWSWMMEFVNGMGKPVAATAVVFLAVMLSFIQKLGLGGEMVYAIFRAFLQLSVIGFVLQFIFNQQNFGWIILAYLFMVSVAGYTAGERAKRIPRGKYVAGASILTGTSITMSMLVLLRVFPFTPRYIIPIAGMMVGNSMTVTGVTMKRLRDDIKTQTNLVETALALGATPRQATHQQVKRALVIALSPVVDNAKTVGLISLPGAMTGLIMGGASPVEAIQLQIVVMNMLIGASTISSIMSTYLCWSAFFTKAYQLDTKVGGKRVLILVIAGWVIFANNQHAKGRVTTVLNGATQTHGVLPYDLREVAAIFILGCDALEFTHIEPLLLNVPIIHSIAWPPMQILPPKYVLPVRQIRVNYLAVLCALHGIQPCLRRQFLIPNIQRLFVQNPHPIVRYYEFLL